MIYKVLSDNDVKIAAKLAHKIWNEYYVPIIGQQQVDYMLEKFQSFNAISSQISDNYDYFLISENNLPKGYLCLFEDHQLKKMMISKIYVDKSARGLGFGKQLIDFAKETAKEKEMKTIWLTVNKNNSNSIKWYEQLNFKIVEEVKMDIGNGFIMDDFILQFQF